MFYWEKIALIYSLFAVCVCVCVCAWTQLDNERRWLMLQARSGQRYENRPCHNTYRLAVTVPSGSVYSPVSPFVTHVHGMDRAHPCTLLHFTSIITHTAHTPWFFLSIKMRCVSGLCTQIITNQSCCSQRHDDPHASQTDKMCPRWNVFVDMTPHCITNTNLWSHSFAQAVLTYWEQNKMCSGWKLPVRRALSSHILRDEPMSQRHCMDLRQNMIWKNCYHLEEECFWFVVWMGRNIHIAVAFKDLAYAKLCLLCQRFVLTD